MVLSPCLRKDVEDCRGPARTSNGDGSISRAAAQASPALVIVFPDSDTNSDGVISVIELEAVPLVNPDGTPVQ